ncbi:uncharacterized protein LOC102079335 isoform X1 [Oreochromis niloticus]|uniref:uncharacterized protein LOC102079335 isoform X1 n=1 Tax=Oreochromis niloticus TaxID=8128 RepID=UPI0006741191|nr:uncharacterized protein LOC102079335 isoform X1 [Oreochromis niloticus]
MMRWWKNKRDNLRTVKMCNLEAVRGNWMEFNQVKCTVDWIISEDRMLFMTTLLDSKFLIQLMREYLKVNETTKLNTFPLRLTDMGNIKVELEQANQSEGITEPEGRPLRRSSEVTSSLVTSAVKFLDQTSTRMSLEAESNLPSTPRLIMLGQSLMTATCWMVSAEGRVIVELDKENTFADAVSLLWFILCIEPGIPGVSVCNIGTNSEMIHGPCFLDICTRRTPMKTSSLAILQEAVSVQ